MKKLALFAFTLLSAWAMTAKQLPDRWTMLVRWLVRSQSTHYLPEILTLPLRCLGNELLGSADW